MASFRRGSRCSLPFDPSLGRLRITKFFFDKTDVVPGPADPEVFADALHIQLYDPESGHYWWQSHFVATPQGLAMILRGKAWRYLHAPDILVLPRYDLEEIRRAAVSASLPTMIYSKTSNSQRKKRCRKNSAQQRVPSFWDLNFGLCSPVTELRLWHEPFSGRSALHLLLC